MTATQTKANLEKLVTELLKKPIYPAELSNGLGHLTELSRSVFENIKERSKNARKDLLTQATRTSSNWKARHKTTNKINFDTFKSQTSHAVTKFLQAKPTDTELIYIGRGLLDLSNIIQKELIKCFF